MNVLIIGAGRRGQRLARHLIEENKSVTFLDRDQTKCTATEAKLDCMAVCGLGTDIEALEQAGVRSCDAVIALTDSDEINLVSCGIVKSNFPNVKTTIASTRSISYISDEEGSSHPILGISHIVNPDFEASERIVDIVESGLYNDTIAFPDTEFLLFTIQVGANSPFIDKTLIECRKSIPGNYVITGILRSGEALIPSGRTIIKRNDTLAIIIDNDETFTLLNKVGDTFKPKRPKKMVLVGATGITRFLLKKLSPDIRKGVILTERDKEICEEFSRLFPDITVLNVKITDETIWEDEDFDKADVLVSLTDDDELNIISASYAKTIGVSKSIALLKTNTNYMQFARNLGIDAPISTTVTVVDSIVKQLRGKQVSTMHTLFDGDLEVYEYVIPNDFKYIGKALRKVDMKGRMLIAGVKRKKGDSFIPGGNYEFQAGDSLLLITSHADGYFFEGFIK
ncbi:MAG: Trk system potassium transporter TrkA [Sphaerochaetaceae bacterium]|nr:Trk system potassium transporter TrkA [Sphaerochaetaceae bacterium]